VESRDEKILFLSVLTLGEIYKGISKLSESKKKSDIRLWKTICTGDLKKEYWRLAVEVTLDEL